MSGRVVWINGAFGAGKTTLAHAPKALLPSSMLYDPELTGAMLRRTLPEPVPPDFQDIPIWRRLVAVTLIELHRAYPHPLIVPMTLVVPDYLDEIFGQLGENQMEVAHYFLDPGEAVLRQRIRDQVIVPSDPTRDEEVRQWRLEQIARCQAFARGLPSDMRKLDATRPPGELASQVLAGFR
jgi:hypothetical protein